MTTPTKADPGRRIRAVKIACRIIEILQQNGETGVTEIANELGHSKSTIHSHLQTLEEERIVVKRSDKYRLSLKTLDIAWQVRNQIGNYDIITSEVDSLAEETGEVVQFGIEEYQKVTYLYKKTGERGVSTASRIGKQQPMYSTALGKTILAYLSDEKRREIVDQLDFEPKTETTITSVEELRENLEAIRDRGYTIDDEENVKGIRCVAAPVLDENSVLGAISITGPSSRMTDDRIETDLSERIQHTANVIELNSKYH